MSESLQGYQQHPVFTTDPAEYMQWLYKEICVTTEDGSTHTGRCYTVDPVSQSIVLVKFESSDSSNSGDTDEKRASKLQVIMGHCIQNVTVLDDNTTLYENVLDKLFVNNQHGSNLTPEQVKEKQNTLKSWLLKNRIPVEVSKENSDLLSIADAVFISPPYEAENCQSTNEIVLGKVQGLIKNMPKDQKNW